MTHGVRVVRFNSVSEGRRNFLVRRHAAAYTVSTPETHDELFMTCMLTEYLATLTPCCCCLSDVQRVG